VGDVTAIDGLTPTEAWVVSTWTELLPSAPGSPDADFFDLGGQSLTFVRFLARVDEHFGVGLAVDELFDGGVTVRGAAQAIERAQLDQLGEEELAELVAELEGLSEDEVRALLVDRD
jgi:acyl carrier protein